MRTMLRVFVVLMLFVTACFNEENGPAGSCPGDAGAGVDAGACSKLHELDGAPVGEASFEPGRDGGLTSDAEADSDAAQDDEADAGPFACYAGVGECNPLASDSCADGWSCDINDDGVFACYEPPNDALEGEACNHNDGPFCAHGLTCPENVICERFCCKDSDCAEGQTCKEWGSNGLVTLKFCRS